MSSRIRKYDSGHEKRKKKKKGLSSLLKLRKVLLIDLLLNKLKLVEKIKLFRQTLMKIMVMTETILKLTLQTLMKLGTVPMVLMLPVMDQLVLITTVIQGFVSSLIYLIQDIGMDLIKNKLIFWSKRVLKDISLFRKVKKTDYLEGFLQHCT
jgi:hypothetical protein